MKHIIGSRTKRQADEKAGAGVCSRTAGNKGSDV